MNLEGLRGGTVVSVQAEATSVLGAPETIALLARCAEQNGARAVRIEGLERIRAVRAAVAIPIVGIVKRAEAGTDAYITPHLDDVHAVAAAGADIVAFDATRRTRTAPVERFVATCRQLGRGAMADCADAADGEAAAAAGADIVATTLCGYTDATRGSALPALDLVRAFARRHPFAVCEGGIASPEDARAAFAAGASAIVVGTAITNVDALVRRFVMVRST